jgi:excisionase family DNA binding protein
MTKHESGVPDRPLTLIDAAEYLQLPIKTVRQLCKSKRISHAKLHYRAIMFRREDLDTYLANRTVRANNTFKS